MLNWTNAGLQTPPRRHWPAHNPAHHGSVQDWQDWPFSSAQEYLAQMGRQFAERTWREYPILEYGKGWDDPAS